jgi:signal transduction histidine kinase
MLGAEVAVERLPSYPRDDRRIRFIVGAVMLALIAAVLVHLGYSVARQRSAALATAEDTTRNLARVIEEQARGGIDAADATLASIARALPLLPEAREPRDRRVHWLLRENLRGLPFVRALWVVDPGGTMIHDTDDLPGTYDLSDRQYFQVHRDDPSVGVHVDPPMFSRFGVWFMAASRRVEDRDGHFAGVVVAALEPRYFDRFYESIKVGTAGVVMLMRPDGTIVTRAPGGEQHRGKKLANAPLLFDGLARGDSGTYRITSSLDGVERIYSFRRVRDRPLVVLVGLGVSETLAAWRASVLTQGIATAVFIVLIAWLVSLGQRELRRRKRAQALVESHRAVLERVADGAPLPETLEALVRLIERHSPGTIGSILLLDEDGTRLRHGAAPGLPAPYNAAVDGLSIGAGAGSCGTAAFRREPVVVEDIEVDPLWEDFRELARAHGLRACWSTPILDRHDRLVGTFALYCRTPRRPSRRDLRLVELATSTAGIAIGRQWEEQALRRANERLQAVSKRLLEVQEKERAALARELHDHLGQSLTAIKLSAGALARTLDGSAAQHVRQSVAIADHALSAVRALALDLRPPQLDQLGLAAALRDAIERLADHGGIEANFVDESGGVVPDPVLATAVFRVAQEALTNITRHAEARHVLVELRGEAGDLVLVVLDDGVGFDYDAARARAVKGTSMGILGMEERVALAGGTLRVVSRPGQGTRVHAIFPLAGQAQAVAP